MNAKQAFDRFSDINVFFSFCQKEWGKESNLFVIGQDIYRIDFDHFE